MERGLDCSGKKAMESDRFERAGLWRCCGYNDTTSNPLRFLIVCTDRPSHFAARHAALERAKCVAIGSRSYKVNDVALYGACKLQFVQCARQLFSLNLDLDPGGSDLFA